MNSRKCRCALDGIGPELEELQSTPFRWPRLFFVILPNSGIDGDFNSLIVPVHDHKGIVSIRGRSEPAVLAMTNGDAMDVSRRKGAFNVVFSISQISICPCLRVFFVANDQIERSVRIDRKDQLVAFPHVERIDFVLVGVDDFGFMDLVDRAFDFFRIGLRTAFLPIALIAEHLAGRIARPEVALRGHQAVTIPAHDSQITPTIVGRIAIDMMLLDRLARLMADAACVPVRRHEAVSDFGGDRAAVFQEKSITRFIAVPGRYLAGRLAFRYGGPLAGNYRKGDYGTDPSTRKIPSNRFRVRRVKQGDFEELRKALRLTHTFWGGRFNPIIPLGDSELAGQLIKTFRLDCLLLPI